MCQEQPEPKNSECKSCPTCPNKEEEKVSMPERRQFMKVLLSIFALSWGSMTLIPILQYLTPIASDDAGQEVKSISLGKVDTLAKGQGKNFQFGKKPAVIVRDEAGDFHAYSAVCTHLGCTVQYSSEKANIWCACHGGQYDAKTGKNITGPPPKPLQQLQAEVVNGEIIISKMRSKTSYIKERALWS